MSIGKQSDTVSREHHKLVAPTIKKLDFSIFSSHIAHIAISGLEKKSGKTLVCSAAMPRKCIVHRD